jgi:hypothetical protein
MKQFEDRVNFQGSAQSQGFSPVNAPDVTPLLRQNMETEQRSLDNSRRAGLQQFELNKLTNLAAFSETLSNTLVEQVKQKNERDQEEGLQLAYMNGLPEDIMTAYDAEVDRLKTANDGIQQVADVAQTSGAPFEGVQQIRNLSGWKRYGYAMGIAQQAGGMYPVAMEQALANLPEDASAADRAAALATARGEFMRKSGLVGMNPALLNKHTFPVMRGADAAMLNRWRKADISRQQDLLVDESISLFQGDPISNFTESINGLVRSGRYSRGDARKYLLSQLKDVATITSIGGTLSWDGKQTWADKYPIEFEEAKKQAVKAEIDDYESQKASQALEGKRWFDQVQELWENQPPSDLEIEEAKRKMSDDFDYVDSRLERWASRSTDSEAKQYWRNQFQRMEIAGVLSEGMLTDPSIPYDVVKDFRQRAQALDEARSKAPEFAQYTKQLKDDIEQFAKTNQYMPGSPGTELAIAKAQGDYSRIFNQQIQGGADPATAASTAYASVKAQIDAGKTGVGSYKFDSTEGFTQIIPRNVSFGWDRHKKSIDHLLSTNKTKALDRNALIPKSILQEAKEASASPNYSYPPIAQYISDRFGGQISPWEVLNRQSIAQGLGALATPPALQEAQQVMRPEFIRMLSYKPSYNRVSRAYMSTGSFNPRLVPGNYGDMILQAAQQNGIDPGLLAGLIEAESGFNPNARSQAGAQGIAQIMPNYHPGVNTWDPKASIFYAAKHLKGLQAATGSINEAIYAYNGGLGGIRKSRENREYGPKVLKAAAKYGYGANKSPWSNPALLNPRIAYITGSVGPTSTGPHLDVKRADGGRFGDNALDRYVEVDDPQLGRVPLSRVRQAFPGRGDNFDQHVARGSHGIDYPTAEGSKVYLRGGARVVSSQPTRHGDKLTIELPNGQKYTFLHGKRA